MKSTKAFPWVFMGFHGVDRVAVIGYTAMQYIQAVIQMFE